MTENERELLCYLARLIAQGRGSMGNDLIILAERVEKDFKMLCLIDRIDKED